MEAVNIRMIDLKQEPDDLVRESEVLPGEIEAVQIGLLTLKGEKEINETPGMDYYDVLFGLDGKAMAKIKNRSFMLKTGTIIKIPFNEQYVIQPSDHGAHLIRIRRVLDSVDLDVITKNKKEHSSVFTRAFEDYPVYTEDIKSSKSTNRMILPEGKVPRFCMGVVETEGPDTVAEHEHPMLDQLFFGLKGCRCTCTADGISRVLTENMMLHIPLGSKHSVSVADGEKLAYIWFDFFLTLEGQKYMDEQHRLNDK